MRSPAMVKALLRRPWQMLLEMIKSWLVSGGGGEEHGNGSEIDQIGVKRHGL
ncbi:hypothetical protein [Roseovarius carneus]|uniref:hypothetical protein n=1 Tax=Roseovarius carneus TaxID=2853164 RepID=UPI001CCDB732|nr:hypothetical protein [Roseovarius carneus]